MTISDARMDNEVSKFAEGTAGKVGVQTIQLNKEFLEYQTSSTVTFVAGTTGKDEAHDLLTVTGTVALSIFGVCTTNVAGAGGTIEVGTATSTAGLIAQTTGTDIDKNDIWHDATPDASIELTSIVTKKIVTEDVIYTIATAALSAGVITFYVFWAPISSDGNVVVA